MKKLSIIFFIVFCQLGASSQSVYKSLNYFLNQDFFTEYEELRSRSEESVRQFKYLQHKYSDEEIESVQYAYNASADYFNAVLINIKNDMLDKRKRNFMVNFPDDYGKQVEADIYRAREFYANTFQKEIVQVTNGEITGIAFLTLLPQIIKYAKAAFGIYKKIQKEMNKFNESILQTHLIDKYRFKTWDEIN